MTHGPWCTGTPCPCQQTICSAIHARCCRTSIATSGYCRTGILHPIYQWHLTIRQHGWPHKVQIPTSRSTAQHPFLAAGFIPWKHPRGWKQDHGSPHALAVAAAITNHSPSGLHTPQGNPKKCWNLQAIVGLKLFWTWMGIYSSMAPGVPRCSKHTLNIMHWHIPCFYHILPCYQSATLSQTWFWSQKNPANLSQKQDFAEDTVGSKFGATELGPRKSLVAWHELLLFGALHGEAKDSSFSGFSGPKSLGSVLLLCSGCSCCGPTPRGKWAAIVPNTLL